LLILDLNVAYRVILASLFRSLFTRVTICGDNTSVHQLEVVLNFDLRVCLASHLDLLVLKVIVEGPKERKHYR